MTSNEHINDMFISVWNPEADSEVPLDSPEKPTQGNSEKNHLGFEDLEDESLGDQQDDTPPQVGQSRFCFTSWKFNYLRLLSINLGHAIYLYFTNNAMQSWDGEEVIECGKLLGMRNVILISLGKDK